MEKRNLINAYYLLEHDLKEIVSFIEPTKDNFKTYSHRLYSLYIRACIEFEAACKMILISKKYQLPLRPNIIDYYDIHNYSEYKKINNYEVKLHMSEEILLQPLKLWKKNKSVDWYKQYHEVKHSRVVNFSKANLENVLKAISSVFILLYARYGIDALNQYQENSMYQTDDDDFIYKETSLFRLKSK